MSYSAHLLEGVCPECGQPRETPSVLEVGRLKLDREAVKVWVDGEPAKTTPAQFEILWSIARKRGRVMPFWFLEDDGSGHEHTPDTLRVLVYQIRNALRDRSVIETVRGEGYRIAT